MPFRCMGCAKGLPGHRADSPPVPVRNRRFPTLTGVCRAFCAIFEIAAPSMLHGKRSVNPNERTRRHVAGLLGYVDLGGGAPREGGAPRDPDPALQRSSFWQAAR